MKKSDSHSAESIRKMYPNTSTHLLWIGLLLCLTSCKPDPAKTQSSPKPTTLCWKDLRYGELPPMGAYDAIDSLVKRWNLCYERIETGCEVTDSIENLKKQYESANTIYFKSLEKKLGRNWKQQFDQELQTLDSMNWMKIKHEIDSLNTP
ncbi:hypothetical protein [Chryseobacterium pennipullorum]|nr:hypothetical protein [Chryseobacterium pennipullorum]